MLALLLESALRSLALGAGVWLALTLLRVRNPHAHMTAWTMVLIASLSMPVLMRYVTVTLPTAPPPFQLVRIMAAAPSLPLEAVHFPPGWMQATVAPLPPSRPDLVDRRPDVISPAVDWRAVATVTYLLVAAVLLLRLLTGTILTWRLVRAAPRVGAGWAAGRDVRVSDLVGMPVTFGSTILLPPECLAWSPAKRRAVLLHEGSHVARCDFHVLWLAALNRAVFWFNPFAWWQFVRLAELAEIISDDAAIEILRDRAAYAGVLLDVASHVQRAPSLAMARSGTVRRRVERILAATALPARMDWRRRMLIAAALVPAVAVSAGHVARGTSMAEPRPAAMVPAGQPPSDPPAATMVSAQPPPAVAAPELFVGHYQINPRAILTVTRTDDRLFAQRTGQRKLPLLAAGDGEYAYGSAAARVTFVRAGAAPASALVLHQNGRDWPAARIDAATARAVEDAVARQIAAAPDRFLQQTPAPGSRAALLRGIDAVQRGEPAAGALRPLPADHPRRQTSEVTAMAAALGAVESIFFRGVGPEGYDIYGVKFANGLAEIRLLTGADGAIEDVIFRPDGDDTPGGVVACAEESSLKSVPGTAPIRLVLFNESGADLRLFGLGVDGKRAPLDAIGDERSISILTYVGHPWIVADAAGRCLEIVLPGQRTRYRVVPPAQTGGPLASPRRTPAAGSEDALRGYIEAVERGEPPYHRMTAQVAGETRRQLPLTRAILTRLGPLRGMSFRGVSPLGSDIYTVHFANGASEWRIGLVKEGRIGRVALGPQY